MTGCRRKARLLSISAGVIALGSLVGYAVDSQGLYKWTEGSVGMAINTGLCLILLAGAVVLLSLRHD